MKEAPRGLGVDVRTLGDTAIRMGYGFVEAMARNFVPYGNLMIVDDLPPSRVLVCLKVENIKAMKIATEWIEKDCSDCGERVGYSPSMGDVKKVICPDCFTKKVESANPKKS